MSGNWRRSAGSRDSSLLVKLPGQRRIGALVNQINSFAGDGSREDISSAFIQPFLVYVTNTHTTFSVNTESTYDWKGDDWSVPINPVVAQMLKAGNQLFQVAVGARYWVETPDNGPDGWGLRPQLTFLFPKSG